MPVPVIDQAVNGLDVGKGGVGNIHEVGAAGGVPLHVHGGAAAPLVVFDVDGVQARGQIRQACCLGGPLEVVVVNHRVAIDIKHAAVVAGGGEVDGYRGGAGARDHDIAIPAGLDVVIVAGAEIVIGRVAHAIGEPIVRDIREVDGPDELRGHGRGLISQPGGIAGFSGLDQVLGRGKVEIGADESLARTNPEVAVPLMTPVIVS